MPNDAVGSEHATSVDRAWWVGRANGLFLDALTYLAAHEAAHLTQAHGQMLTSAGDIWRQDQLAHAVTLAAGRDIETRSQDAVAAQSDAKTMEREADANARETLLGDGVLAARELPGEIAIVIAAAASLLLVQSPLGFARNYIPTSMSGSDRRWSLLM